MNLGAHKEGDVLDSEALMAQSYSGVAPMQQLLCQARLSQMCHGAGSASIAVRTTCRKAHSILLLPDLEEMCKYSHMYST